MLKISELLFECDGIVVVVLVLGGRRRKKKEKLLPGIHDYICSIRGPLTASLACDVYRSMSACATILP